MHHDLNKKDILILSKGPTHRLDDTTLTSEKECSMNLTEEKKKFCLTLHYIGSNSFFIGNCVEISKFKAKDEEINACLENVSKGFSVDNMKKILWMGL